MGNPLADHRASGPGRSAPRRGRLASTIFCAALAFFTAGCRHVIPLDTAPLDTSGMNFDAVEQLKALEITAPEIVEVAKARQGGMSDAGCVEALKIFRSRGQAFDVGETIAGLVQVGMSEDTILELARLKQLGLGAGELQATRLAGFSDQTVLEVARHHAEGKPVLSGASLARLKNTGLSGATLFELARRGVPDAQADAIVSARRHGARDAEILRRFSGS